MKKLPQINTFYKVSLAIFAMLWLVRMLFPSVLNHRVPEKPAPPMPPTVVVEDKEDEPSVVPVVSTPSVANRHVVHPVRHPHPIRGVQSYDVSFPDLQDVQIVAAQKWGVEPPRNREEAEQRKNELVYVGCSPYYHIDPSMSNSIPYLVPRAALMLQRIGSSFFDSCYVKGIPLHKIIVSSVLRSEEDVERLSRDNGNVSKQSCHRYGTTIDICYTRFHPVSNPDGPQRRTVRDDTLKWVLSEVLRDMREEGACYVKHEVKQSCFHITVR